jgi:hypothetical protein
MRDLSCKIDFDTNTLTIKNKYFVAKNKTAVTIPPNVKRKIYIQPTLPFRFNNVTLLCKTKPEFRHIFGNYVTTNTDKHGLYLIAFNRSKSNMHIDGDKIVGNVKITPHGSLLTTVRTGFPVHTQHFLEEYSRETKPSVGPVSFRQVPSLDTGKHRTPSASATTSDSPPKSKHLNAQTKDQLIDSQLDLKNTRFSPTAQSKLQTTRNHTQTFRCI